MVVSSLYMLTIIITISFLFFVIQLIYKLLNKRSFDHPPGSTGWPILGENIQFGMLGALKFVEERMKKHSQDVFKTSLMGENMATICGSKGNKFFFANDTNLFTMWCPKPAKRSLFFPEFADQPLEELTAVVRSTIAEFLKPETLKQYISIMYTIARKHVEKDWVQHGQVVVHPLSKNYTFELGCRFFMSMEDQLHIKKLLDHFEVVVKGITTLPIYLPGTSYYSAIKHGIMLRDDLLKIIKNKRKDLMENHEKRCQDLMSRLILMTDGNGKYISEKVICNNIVALLLGSYETASTAITFVLKYLAEYPNIYKQVLQEQMEIAMTKGNNELLTWEDTEKMKYTWNVIRESMRLMPSAIGSFRESKKEFTYAGFTIPKGWKVLWTVYSTHMNPKYFPNPEMFDPSRFEGNGLAPFTFTPFGGGHHMCPGKEYAKLEILTFIHNIVRKFKLEKALSDEKVVFLAIPRPEKGLPMRLLPHENTF